MMNNMPQPAPPAQHGNRPSLLEYALIAYGAALVIALVTLILIAVAETGTWLLIAPPLATAAAGFATQSRQIVWLAIGACLSLGVLAIFSVGFVLIHVAICLFGWWYFSSRRIGRPVFVWADAWWEAAGFVPFLIFVIGVR
jgi:hypothetical protein